MLRALRSQFNTRGVDRLPATARRETATSESRRLDTMAINDYRAWVDGLCKRLRLKEMVNVDEVVAAVTRYLGCTIELKIVDWEGAELYGAVCPSGVLSYVIALRHDLSRRQRIKTIYHELAHILRAHTTATGTQFRSFEPTTQQDIEAEEIARILMVRTLHDRQSFLDRFIERMGGIDA